MERTEAYQRLAGFRQEVYQTALGQRQDSLFEILDALLTADGPQTLAQLSQAPSVRRRWSSFADALAAGRLDVAALHGRLSATLPAPAPGKRPVWAVDGTIWPRPSAQTSPARTYGRTPLAAAHPDAVLRPSWEY
jgi:DDE superfamily endonuclease